MIGLARLWAYNKALGFVSHLGAYFGSNVDRTIFEADGTLKAEGNATVWKDVDFPIVVRTTGANQPVMTAIQGNLLMPLFIVNDFTNLESQEFIHEWKEGSSITWHLHLFTNGTDTTDRFVKFELEYFFANPNGTLTGSNTIVSTELTIPANTPAKTHLIKDISTIVVTGGKIAAHAKVRVRRIAATGTAPTAAGIFCEMVQMHVECDTLGSRGIITK